MIYGQIEFPIEGPLREVLLLLEWLIVYFFLELAFIFFIRVKKQQKEIRTLLDKAIIFIFLGWSSMWLFYIIGDYYVETQYSRLLIFNIGYFVRMIFGLIFFYIMEKYQIFIKKFLFTIIFIIMIVLSIILSIFAIEYTQTMSTILFWLPFILFISLYMIKLGTNPQIKIVRKNFKWKFYLSIIGFFAVVLGFGATSDPMVTLMGWNIRLIGDISQLIGVAILSYCFSSIPSLTEYTWQDKIDKLFLMMDSGICIYVKSFRDNIDIGNEQGITGSINSIKIILEKLTNKTGGSIIEKEGKVIIIQPRGLITGIIIADEYLHSLELLLEKFTKKVEIIYNKILKNWDGKLKVFESINNISREIFF